jgi:hypothetical protein
MQLVSTEPWDLPLLHGVRPIEEISEGLSLFAAPSNGGAFHGGNWHFARLDLAEQAKTDIVCSR